MQLKYRIACCTVSLITLGTTASLDWEQAILASYVLDADSNYVHPSFIKLPLGTIADLSVRRNSRRA